MRPDQHPERARGHQDPHLADGTCDGCMDGEHGYDQVLAVRNMTDEELDQPLPCRRRAVEEYQLFNALKSATKTPSLESKIPLAIYEHASLRTGKNMTALRLLRIILKHVEIPLAQEHLVLT